MPTRYLAPFFRLLTFLVVPIVCIGVTGCTSKKAIVNGLEEREANEIMVFLASKGIEAYKVKAVAEGPGGGGGPVLYDISVDSDKVPEAMAILNAAGLPRRRTQKLLDLFTSGGLVPSEMQEKIRYQSGLAEQIAGTIRKIDGIIDADVELSFPEEDPLNPKVQKHPVTAAVFVKHNGVLDDPNSQLVPKIRRLVSGSVQGLNFENVTVIPIKAYFSELSPALQAATPARLEFVRIWSVPIAKDAVGTFRAIFSTLIAVMSIFVISTFWLLWKIIPVTRACGGFRRMFSFHPLEFEEEAQPKTEELATKLEGEAKKIETEEPKVQENVES